MSSNDTEPVEAPAERSRHGNPAFADVVRSMLVMAVIVLGLWFLGQLVWGHDAPERPKVEYAQTVEQVRESVSYPVYAPTSLPKGWGANGVTYDPGTPGRWHLGVLTDDERYIGLEQQDESAERMVDEYAKGAEPRGDVQVAGQTWRLFTGGGETAYVKKAGTTTLLVGGPAPRADIERYLGLLSAK